MCVCIRAIAHNPIAFRIQNIVGFLCVFYVRACTGERSWSRTFTLVHTHERTHCAFTLALFMCILCSCVYFVRAHTSLAHTSFHMCAMTHLLCIHTRTNTQTRTQRTQCRAFTLVDAHILPRIHTHECEHSWVWNSWVWIRGSVCAHACENAERTCSHTFALVHTHNCTHTHAQTHTHTHKCTHTHSCTQNRMRARTHTRACMRTHECTHAHTHTHIHAGVNTHVHKRIHAQVYGIILLQRIHSGAALHCTTLQHAATHCNTIHRCIE